MKTSNGSVNTKKDLVTLVASKTGISKGDTEKCIESLFETVAASLENGTKVRLTNFGSFSIINVGARKGVNPLTGKQINIDPVTRVKFTVGKGLKTRVNK